MKKTFSKRLSNLEEFYQATKRREEEREIMRRYEDMPLEEVEKIVEEIFKEIRERPPDPRFEGKTLMELNQMFMELLRQPCK